MTADDVLTKSGLSSSSIKVDFDETAYDLACFERFYDDGSSVKTSLTRDLMLYSGGNDGIYAFKKNVESSNPPPLTTRQDEASIYLCVPRATLLAGDPRVHLLIDFFYQYNCYSHSLQAPRRSQI
jgi:hypothetical protein